ncbi:exodeoxyribonuclease VII large subunit [Deferribacter autotrophicus]|uniref:Exodeoxyribonuclease 7 large subunit n=1 Tax=Deferribacter autotrophicus TaxID=500465 RepID=A0A5A8F8V0_9BACT|nr:exodeoxyribonuclease VII large subunit [Deferribacter autotrophicus]KAA0259321.1 exodeoxyribonuclease VII large subunit [Deferribacter autotrophicus]
MKKFTVSELTKSIKRLLEGNFPSSINVVGEVSNYSVSTLGHCYFTLKDENAQIKCVFFKRYRLLNSDYEPKNGDKVIVTGDLTVYEKDGNYQLLVKKIEYDSVGDFYKKFEETKRKLEKEGLFDTENKKEIPFFVKKVAVVTSPSGAAIKDFIRTLRKNGANIDVDLWPAPVQGDDAIPVIINQLSFLNQFTHLYDVVVLMRGGGSLEDLSIFNDEFLARAFYACNIPTISAIGHERDFTICDFVADLRVATPTAAAEKLSEYYITIGDRIDNLERRLVKEFEHNLIMKYQYLDTLEAKLLKNSPVNKIRQKIKELEFYENNIISLIKHKLSDMEKILSGLMQKIIPYNPTYKLAHLYSTIDNSLKIMTSILMAKMQNSKDKIDNLINALRLLNPENILDKGYAIVIKEKKPVGSVKNIHLEDELEIRMKDGYISSFVTGKKTWRK